MFKSNTVAAAAGAGGLSFPLWDTLIASGWSTLIGIAGGIVLLLTIWNKVLEIRLKNRALREPPGN